MLDVWATGDWPQDWCESTFVAILKKGDPRRCEKNYRTISLVSHVRKVLLNVILHRIQPMAKAELDEEQAGFPTAARENKSSVSES